MKNREMANQSDIRRQMLDLEIERNKKAESHYQEMENTAKTHYNDILTAAQLKNKILEAAMAQKNAAESIKSNMAMVQKSVDNGADPMELQKAIADGFSDLPDKTDFDKQFKQGVMNNPVMKAISTGHQMFYKTPPKTTSGKDTAASLNADRYAELIKEHNQSVASGDMGKADVIQQQIYLVNPQSRPKNAEITQRISQIPDPNSTTGGMLNKTNTTTKTFSSPASLGSAPIPADDSENDENDGASEVDSPVNADQSSIATPPVGYAPNPSTPSTPVQATPQGAGSSIGSVPTVVPTVPAGVPITPKIVTDRRGVKWLYHGVMADPTKDKTESNWSAVPN